MDMSKEEQHVDAKEEEKVDRDGSDCVVPVTPDAVREKTGDFDIQLQSPLTLSVVRKQLNEACIDSPRTPKDVVFDPFARGGRRGGPDEEDDMDQRAPQSNKYLDDFSKNTVARQLNFQHIPHAAADQILSDEEIFVSVYQNLLQFIISKQTEERFLAQFSNNNLEYADEDYVTPAVTLLPFTGRNADDSCPGAPLRVKSSCQPRIIPVGLCKKLEF